MIRRRKKDVLPELPAKLRVIMEVPATTPGQKKAVLAFNKAWGQYENDITSLEERYRLAMTARDESEYAKAVDRLQKAYNVAFFEMASVRHEIGLQKVPLIIEHIGELLETGQKIVVFAHHVDVIQQIKDHFAHSVAITGKTPVEERAMIVERFQNDPNTRLFIGNIQAAGTGITLHASSTAVFAELDWVPANLNQAEDRLHRIGQSDNVLVHHIVFEGSLDARMAEVIVEKQDIIRRALD
jgi:SWI/SNF-related matrix-associated actin-dependent regulator 1 of chromatin subfamily A